MGLQRSETTVIRPDRRLRIGHVVDCFGAGGIATGVFTLIRSTLDLVDHTIISLSDDLRLLAQLPSETPAYVIKPGPSKLVGFCTVWPCSPAGSRSTSFTATTTSPGSTPAWPPGSPAAPVCKRFTGSSGRSTSSRETSA